VGDLIVQLHIVLPDSDKLKAAVEMVEPEYKLPVRAEITL